MRKIIAQSFFVDETAVVARNLLGKFLVRPGTGSPKGMMITETEAYDGPRDKACHASGSASSPHGRRTKRTEVMFQEGGRYYVYLCYGMYWMLNIVTGPEEYPAAVLIRGVRAVDNALPDSALNGPGKLTRQLGIDTHLNGKPVRKKSGLWVEDRGIIVRENDIKRTPRIGIASAGPYWARRKLRFVMNP